MATVGFASGLLRGCSHASAAMVAFSFAIAASLGCAHGARTGHRAPTRGQPESRSLAVRTSSAASADEGIFPAKDLLALAEDSCRARLDHVPLEVRTGAPTRGVRDPFRLVGSVESLAFKPSWPTKRSDPAMEVVDCRLLLAFAEAAPIFARHGVTGLVYLSAYRPPSGDLEASLRKSRHGAGMALDIGLLDRGDGTRWNIAKDFPKELGRPPCEGREAEPDPGGPEDLRSLVCDLAISGIFSVVLTPNFNHEHHDHVHVELNPRVPSVYLR